MNELALPIADDVMVCATNPREMAQAQAGMVGWCQAKMDQAARQCDEFERNMAEVAEAGWPREAVRWRKQVVKARKRLEFYEKIKLALEAGYLIVPPLPFQAFAIRTKATKPTDAYVKGYGHDFKQSPQALPVGQGEYQNPFPAVLGEDEQTTDLKGQVTRQHYQFPGGFKPIDFPFALVKPEILAATTKALASKIFDALGVLPRYQAPDPIVVGDIISPSGNHIYFFVAWWLDPSKLK